jgi:hypothetical protein
MQTCQLPFLLSVHLYHKDLFQVHEGCRSFPQHSLQHCAESLLLFWPWKEPSISVLKKLRIAQQVFSYSSYTTYVIIARAFHFRPEKVEGSTTSIQLQQLYNIRDNRQGWHKYVMGASFEILQDRSSCAKTKFQMCPLSTTNA